MTKTETNARTSSSSDRSTTASILLVDDDAELLKALAKVLEKENLDVVALPDGPSAMEYITRTQRAFDLVITDVAMPRLKGTEFLTLLKKAFPRIPVILITAYGDWDQYMDALREGAFDYLSKPLDKSELLNSVRRALATLPPQNHLPHRT